MPQPHHHRLAFGLTLATWGLIVFGASVRVHGAGLACPDWPLCFGEVIPPLDFQVGLEFGHRVLAGGISLGFLGLGWAIRGRSRALRGLWLLAAAVLVLQVILGGLTVLELLAEWTVTSHLLAGNTFCALLLVLGLTLRGRGARPPVGAATRGIAIGIAGLVAVQLALGGGIASSNAGLACAAFPSCNGGAWFPTFRGLMGWVVLHRVVAYTLLAAATLLCTTTRGRGPVGRTSVVLWFVIVAQGLVGVANVWLRLPVEVTLMHSFGAAGVVLTTAWLHQRVWTSPQTASLTMPSGQVAMEGA